MTVKSRKPYRSANTIRTTWKQIEYWPTDTHGTQYFFIYEAVSSRRISISSVAEEIMAAIPWIADRHANHDDSEQLIVLKRILRADGTKAASKVLSALLLEVEKASTFAFFKRIKNRIDDDPRLLRLAETAEESMQVRWSLQDAAQRKRQKNRKNALQRRPPFSKDELQRALDKLNGSRKHEVVARVIGVSPVTLRKWAAIYGVTISRSRRRSR